MKRDLFYYDLPQKYIAQKPLENRDRSKLMILNRENGRIKHDIFSGILKYLKSGDVLVLNDTKVVSCRVIGEKEKTGAKIECFILKKMKSNKCLCLIKPYRRVKTGDVIFTGDDYFKIIEKTGYGKALVVFSDKPDRIISKYGAIPLPPYIKNQSIEAGMYQTIYAKKGFSSAGPTAGFHFTKELIESIRANGIIFSKLRLDIGLDTFRPIVEDRVEDHIIHSELYSISGKEADKINQCREKGGRIIAVGTTSTRVLESVFEKHGILKDSSGSTSLYIYPGYRFKIVDAMITNFHLPYSTLLVMVSAFAGRKNILNAYEIAKKESYRFFSFGDCMLIV
jgi:S-adenosylmethionine:tRNA ribosyltransferase-isomerase